MTMSWHCRHTSTSTSTPHASYPSVGAAVESMNLKQSGGGTQQSHAAMLAHNHIGLNRTPVQSEPRPGKRAGAHWVKLHLCCAADAMQSAAPFRPATFQENGLATQKGKFSCLSAQDLTQPHGARPFEVRQPKCAWGVGHPRSSELKWGFDRLNSNFHSIQSSIRLPETRRGSKPAPGAISFAHVSRPDLPILTRKNSSYLVKQWMPDGWLPRYLLASQTHNKTDLVVDG
ncbi:uncharacterized protein B0T15DRAFT_14714 [Chaetomium strumarium]|uniref:Uncharacterized protein n=1 Tax=Chaetomium strumarium TaxID=1170767 RepID=A0AAJ0H0X5_9PEZI|nr:hypothetical protein B0T15DRAFT_14714 [Chaetomium strumarium]